MEVVCSVEMLEQTFTTWCGNPKYSHHICVSGSIVHLYGVMHRHWGNLSVVLYCSVAEKYAQSRQDGGQSFLSSAEVGQLVRLDTVQ
jgi:hypothetical protein